jgi:hypothetical protein
MRKRKRKSERENERKREGATYCKVRPRCDGDGKHHLMHAKRCTN